MSDHALQPRLPTPFAEQYTTPSERSASSDGSIEQSYEAVERTSSPDGMDTAVDQPCQTGTPERPRCARHYAEIYAAELGHPTLFNGIGIEDIPILIWNCGRGSRPVTYTFNDFLRLEDHQVRHIILGIMIANDDEEVNKWPSSTLFIDDNHKRQVVKDRLNRAFLKRFQPVILFAGDKEEAWTMSNTAERAQRAQDTPVWNPKTRRKYTTWTSANLAVPSIDKLKEAITYADRFYKNDDEKIGKVHRILSFASNYANCEMMRNKLQTQMHDLSLINTFETLVNLMHTQLHFQDEHSVLTWANIICDQAVRLLSDKIEQWIPEAVRLTTSGLKRESQDLNWKRSTHAGLLFPHEDIAYKEATNSRIIRELEEKANQVGVEGTIDFQKAMELRTLCNHLLYVNDWTRTCHEQEIYVDDVISLIEAGREIFGIDPPIDRTERAIKNGENKRTITHAGSTYHIRFCNNLHVNAETSNPDRKICLYCGGARHHTSDHFGYKHQGQPPQRGEMRFDSYTTGYRRFDNIAQTRAKHSFQEQPKPVNSRAYNKVVQQITATTQTDLPSTRQVSKKKKPLSRIIPLQQQQQMQQPTASSSRRTMDDEELDDDTPSQRRPHYAARGEAVKRFHSNRKNKDKYYYKPRDD
jgi:antitoxin (DNA-binding transcriptional repressor) of toxin-antitoxin stability system